VVADGVRGVDADRLGAWLAAHVPTARDTSAGAGSRLVVEQLSGGASNLTFRVRDGRNDWVLRRPPLSHVLATANDMRREHTVQRALAPTDVPTAGVVAFCDDESVIGAPFYVMEHVDGVVYASASDVGHLDEVASRAATDELMDVLARLHAVDPDAVGLTDFGRPDGFLERQIGRWTKQWEAAKTRELPLIDEVAARLTATVPATSSASIVHGDYSFNNTMWCRDEPARMLAVLDWEMSTLGDPLTDVGMVAVYWTEVGALMWANRPDPQPHRANAGFPNVDVLLDRYATASGRDLGTIDFYRALAIFKLAVICEGNYRRMKATASAADTERVARVDGVVVELATMAHDAAQRVRV
jgi:aminoglycoside phosphotransferase (APT) family kinase protein